MSTLEHAVKLIQAVKENARHLFDMAGRLDERLAYQGKTWPW
jgi:hypothetical protein